MSEVLVGSPAGTIYGTYALAVIYVDGKYGDAYRAWEALAAADRKRTLLSAAAYINQQVWQDDYDTFVERDAVQAFIDASYELGVMIANDPEIVEAIDQGTNIARAYAGGAGVDFANPTSAARGTAPKLPPILMRLIGAYLAAASTSSGATGYVAGSSTNPFDACSDMNRDDEW